LAKPIHTKSKLSDFYPPPYLQKNQLYPQDVHMKNLLKLEELLLFGLALFLFSGLDYGWGWYALLFFAPDLSMLGYLANPRFGAWTYNLIHHKGLSVALYVLGYLLHTPWLMFTATILLGHSSLDRVLGYGLKHEDAFQNTHLGRIGR
jgi:hypothetical protein